MHGKVVHAFFFSIYSLKVKVKKWKGHPKYTSQRSRRGLYSYFLWGHQWLKRSLKIPSYDSLKPFFLYNPSDLYKIIGICVYVFNVIYYFSLHQSPVTLFPRYDHCSDQPVVSFDLSRISFLKHLFLITKIYCIKFLKLLYLFFVYNN